MARTYLVVRGRWWVRPYLTALFAFMWSVAWALEEDDERMADFISKQAEFVAARGFYVASTDIDPGES